MLIFLRFEWAVLCSHVMYRQIKTVLCIATRKKLKMRKFSIFRLFVDAQFQSCSICWFNILPNKGCAMGIWKLIFHHRHTKFFTPRAAQLRPRGPRRDTPALEECRALIIPESGKWITNKNILVCIFKTNPNPRFDDSKF